MANHGSKFVSVNLNKSYGQSSHHSHYTHFTGGGGSYGQAAAAAGRGRVGGGGGGGMLVLSRNRGGLAPKVASKLSVPPPLNLPSLRKEHEKSDISGPGGPGASAGTGSGSRPSSSVVGWSKPMAAAAALQEKNESVIDSALVNGTSDAAVASRAVGSYMPPSARSTGAGVVGSASASRESLPSADTAVLLKGEDFPSLQAARPVSSGASQKQKDGLNQKQKQVLHEESTQDKVESYHLGPMADMHPPGHSLGDTGGNQLVENGGAFHRMAGGRTGYQNRKQEYYPDPLPLVRMNPRSDWADDERDTGHGFVEQGRDIGFSNSGSYWDRDFDLPRPSVLPHKLSTNQYRRDQRDNETGKDVSGEVLKMDPYNKDISTPSREGKEVNKWRTSLSKDGVSSQEMGNHRVDVGARMAGNNIAKENKYIPPRYGETVRDGSATLNRDSAFGRRDLGHVGQHMQRNSSIDSFNNKLADRNSRDHHVSDQPNMYRGDGFQNNTSSRPFIASSGRRPPVTDPILTMGRDKRFSNSDRSFSEDPFLIDYGSAGFDERDLFSDNLAGVIKRKKDAAKSTHFHDPVRESFEAELERVQKMQELERQKIIEEQERALELARREEEDRLRRIREEDERQRRLDEESRQAAWRAEQEQLEVIRKAEEQRIAREEEKKRLQFEEERRKQAARQMLQELEAKMAKRQAEAVKGDVSASKPIVDEKLKDVNEYTVSKNIELETWEDEERMMENVMTSGSFESSAHGRPSEMISRPHPPRESSSNFIERGKSINSWKRDVLEYGGSFPSPQSDQETGHYSPRKDSVAGGRTGPRKELHGGPGFIPFRAYSKVGAQDSYSDEFGFQKEQRWNLSGSADSYGKLREMDLEFQDIADSGWGKGHTRTVTRPPYPERLYPHSEANELYSYGRSRYSVRQPRVPPPPSLASTQRTNIRGVSEHSGTSAFIDGSNHYTHASRAEPAGETDYYGTNHGGPEPSQIFGMPLENSTSEWQNSGSRCDSQSSLSVSSPPTSPPHLSQDELDACGDSPVTSAVAEGKKNLLTGAGSVAHSADSGSNTMNVPDSVSAVEDEVWSLENEDMMQQQEEYDEDEDGFREEEEVRDRGVENLELNQKFDGLELEVLEERGLPDVMDNVVLGFDEGVEVEIPSDDIEKSIGHHQDRSFGMHDGSIGMGEERVIVDGFPSDEQNLLSSSQKILDTSALPGSIGQHVSSSAASVDILDGADSSGSTCLASQSMVSSSLVDVTAATCRPSNLPSVSSAGRQDDLPIKLQFGLFSGPSLIPSPVPAIQIGSIQMPLHIHPPVGPSITHMHPSHAPMFQFGQLRYTSPISQGILPIAPQSMSFIPPNMLGHVNLNQDTVSSGIHEPAQHASRPNASRGEKPSVSVNNLPSVSSKQSDGGLPLGINTVSNAENHDDNSSVHASTSGTSGTCDGKLMSISGSHAEEKGHHHVASKSYPPSSKARGFDRQSHHVQPMMQSVAGEKNYGTVRGPSGYSGGRGRRFAYAVKNSYAKSSPQDYELLADSNGFQRRPRRTVQRTEFRIRENNDRRSASAVASSSAAGPDKLTYSGKAVGVFTRSGAKRGSMSNRSMKHTEPLASGSKISSEVDSGDREAREVGKDLSSRSQNTSYPGEANLRRNVSEDDIHAPLQSGVVRVFKQPGIEAPSDEDDFIEVRSKRQMLNDRREQREKEIKAKSRTTKAPRKSCLPRQKDLVSRSNNKHPVPLSNEVTVDPQLDLSVSESSHFVSDGSTGFIAAASQPSQPPIGTPPVNFEAQAIKPSQSGSVSVISNSETEHEPVHFDSKNKVMSLSQTQIDEAMKPARYDSHVSAGGGHSSPVSDPILQSSSILAKDKSFSSSASPINSLLAGERIQFGAVTSPIILPHSSRVVSHGIGAPGSNRPDVQVSRSFPVTEKDNSLFFEKKHLIDSGVPLQDCEAEAEAAASAVAVAAISSDEIVGKGLGLAKETKTYGGAGITTGVVGDQHMTSQSQGDELLSVSLPADLSIETTPISLWPPLPSPQSSTSQMLSHFPAGPPSHFPFYEMNPLLGGPIFAFSPHEESVGTQSQPPKTTTSNSAPLSNWPQCHSGVDSFYGPPAAYSGPFIGPPGGIHGVQGPPHMVVYNHFAPVGQYGQVGLSFMGTTYIPSGKQADWKNTASSTAMHIGEGDMNNVNMANVQPSAPIAAPIQHLAPGSPLLPMPPPLPMFDVSPLPMFDVSPFPTAPDLSVQARWGHISASPLHSVSISRPLQPQIEGALPSQANHGHPIDQSLTANRFTDSRTPTSSDKGPNFSAAADTNVAPFPTELGLVDSLRINAASSGQTAAVQSISVSANAESGKTDIIDSGKRHQSGSSVKSQFSKKNFPPQAGNTTGLYYQRGQRNNAGNELPHRRMGFHGRGGGMDRNFPAAKMKQIYVAKQTNNGSSST